MPMIAPVSRKPEKVSRFQQVIVRHRLPPNQRCLLIIDAARYEEGEVLRHIYTLDDDPDWLWLLDQTPFERDRDAGPVVVETTLDSALCEHAADRWAGDEAVLVLVSGGERDVALAGFRQSLRVRLEPYGPCFLRPYDSRFLEILAGDRPEAFARLIGNGDLLMWSIDRGGVVDWSSAVGTHTDFRGLNHDQDASFERLLTSVLGFSQ